MTSSGEPHACLRGAASHTATALCITERCRPVTLQPGHLSLFRYNKRRQHRPHCSPSARFTATRLPLPLRNGRCHYESSAQSNRLLISLRSDAAVGRAAGSRERHARMAPPSARSSGAFWKVPTWLSQWYGRRPSAASAACVRDHARTGKAGE
jgi:hypothetical protein